ncbi:MAG: cupin domain-containing protein [Spirochaetes bacterium]|nr:cupin domain-containing protein [Spirochaetota bacterium]
MVEKLVVVPKSWGYEKWIVNNDDYCGKILYFAAGHSCSFHYHIHKHETFYLQSGKMVIYLGYDTKRPIVDKQFMLLPGQVMTIKPTLVHRMTAIEDSELFEFSTHHEDDDSYRLNFDFNRINVMEKDGWPNEK